MLNPSSLAIPTRDPRVMLRHFASTDSASLAALIDKNRSHLKQHLPWLNYSNNEQDSLNFIQQAIEGYQQNKSLILAVCCEEKIIGVIAFHAFDWQQKTSGIGYWIDETFQGQGITQTATEALIDYGFFKLNLSTVTISAGVSNMRSQRIPEKLSFEKMKIIPQKEWLYDHYVDHVFYEMTQARWLEKKSVARTKASVMPGSFPA